jgi:molybdopterin/thiamine biosynthesis adenylyltransferase
MALSPDEIERYARHLVLRDVGGPGQGRLKAARVLVIGAGGLGAPLVQYLAAAGIGTIGIGSRWRARPRRSSASTRTWPWTRM